MATMDIKVMERSASNLGTFTFDLFIFKNTWSIHKNILNDGYLFAKLLFCKRMNLQFYVNKLLNAKVDFSHLFFTNGTLYVLGSADTLLDCQSKIFLLR